MFDHLFSLMKQISDPLSFGGPPSPAAPAGSRLCRGLGYPGCRHAARAGHPWWAALLCGGNLILSYCPFRSERPVAVQTAIVGAGKASAAA
jgi:hypothetical protein